MMKTTGTTQNRAPSAPREAHQQAEFGELIYSYSRAQAIEDGFLVDITETAREAGFRCPVAITRAAWTDCVEWSDADSERQTHQDESGRLWDVVWMARLAARGPGMEKLFSLLRVPRGGRGTRPRQQTLKMVAGPGDDGELTITIMMPEED